MTQTANASGGLLGRPRRAGTGRPLVTAASTVLPSSPDRHGGWPHSFDSGDAAFSAPSKTLRTPAAPAPSSKKQRARTAAAVQRQRGDEDEEDSDDDMFAQLVRQFDAIPDEPEEEKEEVAEAEEEEEEEEEEEAEDDRLTNSPFLAAATPGRLSTASTTTSPSISRLSRASLSPESAHTATRQLDLDDAPDGHDVEDSKSEATSASKNGRRSSTRQSVGAETAGEEEDEPKSAMSEKRRSSGRVSFQVPDEGKGEEQKQDDEDEAPPADMQGDDDDSHDDDDQGGHADMHDDDDDAHSSFDSAEHDADTPSSASPAKPPPRPRRPRGAGGKRRETVRLIDEAKRLGIVAEQEEASLVSGRPKRNRTAPLEWWKGDKYEYAMDEDGIGNLMPIVKSVVRSGPTPEVKKKRKGGAKAGAGKAQKKRIKRESSGSEEESDPEPSAFQSSGASADEDDLAERLALVHSSAHAADIHKVVAKTEKGLPLEYLAQPHSAVAIPTTQLPKGGKAFEEKEFSSGILLLPPRAVKQRELTHTVESFFVVSAERGKLQVTIGSTVLKLSKGDPFIVPVGNVYSLENLSERKEVKVYFHLIQSSEQVEKEVRQRMEEEHSSDDKRRRRRRDDDDDHDDDDEEELN